MREETVIVSIVFLSFICGIFASFVIFPQDPVVKDVTDNRSVSEDIEMSQNERINRSMEHVPEAVKTYLVAVTDEGKGVTSPVWVKAQKGSGRTLVSIETLFFWVDTQYSMRVASEYAREHFIENEEGYDLTYSIDTNTSVVGGPSAGGALTVATVAALKNYTLRQDVTMTGTIERTGRIGEVGGILEKAKAAERAGFEYFLIPEGQRIQTDYIPKKQCRDVGNFRYCTTDYRKRRVDVDKQVDTNVVEVRNITQALDYYIEL